MPLQATTTGTAPEAKAQKILEGRVPDRIGKYVIINEVGRGSTGTVYLSHDSYYGRDVAIKVYNQDSDASDERAKIARKMFLSEAHMVGMLQHPHILPIYDAGEENGRCYIVTEHVHGARTLSAYCRPDNLLRTDFAVVLIDVIMPDLDGFELAAMIREHPRFKRTAIIFVSGIALSDLDRLRGYESGAVDYVPVPVVPEILRAKVKVFAELYRKTRQLERLNHLEAFSRLDLVVPLVAGFMATHGI